MGCWNKTCGLSNLHILDNEYVYVFVLEKNMNEDERCYSTSFWKPILLPFYAQYNEYGGGKDSFGVALPIILNAIKYQMVEFDVGKNQYHDIEVNKDKFDIDLFFDAIHENRLFIKGQTNIPIDFVMVKQEVIHHIFNEWERKAYIGNGEYCYYRFNDVKRDVDAFIDKLCLEYNQDVKDETAKLMLRYRIKDRFYNLYDYNDGNKVSWYIRQDKHRFSRIFEIDNLILECIEIDKIDLAKELLIEYLKGSFITEFMESTRKLWIPGCHEGSQSMDHAGYRVLTAAINQILDDELEDEEDDDFE